MMARVIDFQKRKQEGPRKRPKEPASPAPEVKTRDRGNAFSRLMVKAFWHAASGTATWLYSVAAALGVAIALLSKFAFFIITLLIAFSYFAPAEPDMSNIYKLAMGYPLLLFGNLLYRGLVFLMYRGACRLSAKTTKGV
jgi:hypothetical protein|tara:strand:+ start:5242 stop:5658 length:417 start_codon:yes stop_codon:yes gene_type:complete